MTERTPEQIEAAKARMAKVRAGRTAKKEAHAKLVHTENSKLPINEFEGLTDHHCCDDCKQFCCVITKVDFCGHPKMGGLQSKHMMNPDLVGRFNRAKKYLQHRRIDVRKDP